MTKDSQPRTPEGVFIQRSPVSIEMLFHRDVPQQHRFADETKDFYQKLATQPIFPQVKTFGDSREFLIACPGLKGKELQQVFHFAAPSKAFGVDYQDTQKDWDQLYSNSFNDKRLAAHRKLPGWEHFERDRIQVRSFIGNDTRRKTSDDDVMVPVIHAVQKDHETKWNLSPLDENSIRLLTEHSGNPQIDPSRLRPSLGPVFIAAYAPAITQSWGNRLNYQLEEEGGTQDMGSTQAYALSVALSPTLVDASFFQKLIFYTATGQLPPKRNIF